ncbi:helix-turn-helix domain-containing protein [Nostoc sp.]|uniref:helix-turn-helix domain-containing protein n=1 Tax=Nostoc sp. TaxID=1180 RepID=UPI002FF80D2A
MQVDYESASRQLSAPVRAKLIKSGIEGTVNDRPHPPKPRKLDGLKEAFLIATACSDPQGERI